MADFAVLYKHVLFGFWSYNRKKQAYIINLIIILAKFHIHKCKTSLLSF